MTVILTEPFDSTANWSPTTGCTIVTGRTGNGMQISGTNTPSYTIPGASQTASQRADLWFKTAAVAGTRLICQMRAASARNVATIQVDASGSLLVKNGGTGGTLLATGTAGAVTVNTWCHLVVTATIHVSTGRITAVLNGTTVTDTGNLDTLATGGAVFVTFTLSGFSASTHTFDDLSYESVGATMKTWTGSAFVDAPVKVYNGTAFVDALAVKTWNGSAWV